MVKTHGLTHVGLAVADPERSLRFYRDFDVLAFEKRPRDAGKRGGIEHFGFRLTDPKDIDLAVREVKKAGGRLLRRGEFGPGLPFAYVADPDGYEIEIWFE
jgi:catechol 2,3-dioxygenase-like lactoylglutathione lyase family enzyme